ncbi:M-phase phosphoprotein 9-like [Nematostella vectensis]|uniref:M-phase phosphoprotein 9-like n=1 Tax=Nematostella vectensis TaxID=45351 RepID=UPI00207750D4|nr:M-phase phosphoprotein 9-like [Nematostella vectensis]
MAEAACLSSKDEENKDSKARQDGDGYESNETPVVLTSNGNEKTSNEMSAQDQNDSEESSNIYVVEGETHKGNAGEKKETSARATLASQKDLRLRQQLRQLQSQELIRRILQSTVVVPNYLTKTASTAEGDGQVVNETTKDKESLQKQNNLAQGGNNNSGAKEKEDKEDEVKSVIENFVQTQKSPHNNDPSVIKNISKSFEGSSTLQEKHPMQPPSAFVCSMCSSPHTETATKSEKQYDNTTKDCDSLQSTQDGSVSSLSPNSEEDQEKGNSSAPQTITTKGREPPDVLQLSERLQQQPSHETLDEILKLLQSQVMTTQSQQPKETLSLRPPVMQQTNTPDSCVMGEGTNDVLWNHHQQITMMGAQPNLREKHSRQLADMRDYYEGEMMKLRDQLEMLRGNMSVLQEAVPVKMLEAANHRLEARCNLMEEIAADLKAKYTKLNQHTQEVEVTCNELRQTNEALEMRCLLLQKSNQELDDKAKTLEDNNRIMESKVLHLNQANENAYKSCRQLEEGNKHFEKTCKNIEELKNKMETRYRKCKEDNLKLTGDVKDLQESLLSVNKNQQELEDSISTLEREKRDWMMKLDASQKMSEATQKRYAEQKADLEKKQTTLNKMEEQMGKLSTSLDATSKAKSELEKNAERDKELLKRLLVEYDALAKEHNQTKANVDSWAEKVNSSQDEVDSLRGTITKLIRRNTTLEDSLREALAQQLGSSGKSEYTPPSARKTWGTPVALRAEHSDPGQRSLLLDYDIPSRGPRTSSPAKSEHTSHSGHSDVSHISNSSVMTQKVPQGPSGKVTTSPNGIKFEIPWETSKSSPSKSPVKRNLAKAYSPDKSSSKTPGNLVLKKSDLVTRFDVVFEDTNSGQEVTRSHTGRTSRASGESPTSIYVSSPGTNMSESTPTAGQRLVSGAAEAALNALRTGRVTSQAEWETGENSKKNRERSRERKSSGKSSETSSEKRDEVVHRLERKFSSLTEERKRLESTLSRIPGHRITKRSKDDKEFLEKRLDEVVRDIGSVRMQLRRHHAL